LKNNQEKKRRSASIKSVGVTLTKSGVVYGGAQVKWSDASVKFLNDHPLCGIVTGSRRRKQNSKYL
jgi:hypothetical protein